MNTWVNGRTAHAVDCRDRGLQYGDGLFETMYVERAKIRLLVLHLDRLALGCRRLRIAAPTRSVLRNELGMAARRIGDGVLKLILTRGVGERGYRAVQSRSPTRIMLGEATRVYHILKLADPVRARVCTTPLGTNAKLAGLKTLNRLECVLARSEWRDPHIAEGLMLDGEGNVICGTMTNVFARHGNTLVTPRLDRCGVAGVMRRWILANARSVGLSTREERFGMRELRRADEVFLSNALIGIWPVGTIVHGGKRWKMAGFTAAQKLHERLAHP